MTVLKAIGLQKTYSNGVEAVKNLELEVKKGEVFGFLGPNGAGKSTAINMMTGLLSPSDGRLEVLGFNLPKDTKKLASKIGFVPQDLVFYEHLTLYENLKLFATCYEIEDSKSRITEIMDILQIDELKDRRAGEMSGGQKRRLNLAIGLLHTPELIFLDEPSAGMDPQSRNILWNSIERLSRDENTTIILTTHLMETAERLSDRIAIVNHGVVQVIDTPHNLKKQFGDGDTVVIQFKEDLDDEKLNKIESELTTEFGHSHVFRSPHKIKVANGSGIETIIAASAIIEKIIDKSNVQQISMHESTIEDVFLKITGRELRE
jgi:ABC-2 type transport system ATP-binding protein